MKKIWRRKMISIKRKRENSFWLFFDWVSQIAYFFFVWCLFTLMWWPNFFNKKKSVLVVNIIWLISSTFFLTIDQISILIHFPKYKNQKQKQFIKYSQIFDFLNTFGHSLSAYCFNTFIHEDPFHLVSPSTRLNQPKTWNV